MKRQDTRFNEDSDELSDKIADINAAITVAEVESYLP
jgi:hypothetical protein